MKRFIAVAVAGAMAIPGAGLSAQGASAATTYRACVKKSTGETRMMSGKSTKCKKGWKKVTWGKKAPRGATGPTGAQGASGGLGYFGTVVDGAGAVIGKSGGYYSGMGPMALFQVVMDGGVYYYLDNGWLYPLGSPSYADSACSGAPFLTVGDLEELAMVSGNSTFRFVWRSTVGATLGPARAFKLAGTTRPLVNASTYRLDSSGACVLEDANYFGFAVDATEIPAPADRPGPLRIQ